MHRLNQVVRIISSSKTEQDVQVSLKSSFYSHVSWSVPLPGYTEAALTRVKHKQKLYTWLAAKNLATSEQLQKWLEQLNRSQNALRGHAIVITLLVIKMSLVYF